MLASSPAALRSDAETATVQADRLRAANPADAARFDRMAAILKARASGVTDPAQLRAAARAA